MPGGKRSASRLPQAASNTHPPAPGPADRIALHSTGLAGGPISCRHDDPFQWPPMMLHVDPLYALSGFFVGLLVGQTGMGGGSLMTPILVLLFGVHPATAVGTDLLYASA